MLANRVKCTSLFNSKLILHVIQQPTLLALYFKKKKICQFLLYKINQYLILDKQSKCN